ncbi:MAG: YqgE/AlgH family protein [Bacteroidales bacterium]|nr:YqgE/AlgH family protein [Bacteroidales bacterium]
MNMEYKLKIRRNDLEPAVGRLLIAEPTTYDYFFSRSVVLLLSNDKDGAEGVIINKKLNNNLKNFILESKLNVDSPMYLGGPVKENKIYILHRFGDIVPKSSEIIPGLWWGGETRVLYDLINSGIANDNNLRIFQGYSSWAPMQLKEEMKKNYWAVTELQIDEIFEMPIKYMWNKCVEKLGTDYEFWQHIPENPTLN